MEKFDYERAVEELEQIARKVEDPSAGLGEIDRYIKRADELVEGCRQYLRSLRESVEEDK